MAPDASGPTRGGRRPASRRTAETVAPTGAGSSVQTSDQESARAEDDVTAGDDVVAGDRAATGGGQDQGGGPPISAEAVPDDENDALRREVHALIGQVEALMSHMRNQMHTWCPEDLRAGYKASHERLGPAFGRMHALVADGNHDKDLREHGFAGDHLEFKRRGLRGAYNAVVRAIGLADSGNPPRDMPDRMGVAAQAALTVAGSIADAVGLATPIKEAIALVPTAVELFKRERPS
jgi:hypothetical protein